jgi:predicted dehydrogenase
MATFTKFGSKRNIRILQVGCGAMGQGWVERIIAKPGLDLIGLVDIRPSAAEATAARFRLVGMPVFASLDDAIRAGRPDVVVDITVPSAHYQVTRTALKAGCHVLGEKPLADTLAHARAMCRAARLGRRLYMVTQNRRHLPAMVALRDAVRTDAIGRLSSLDADFYIGAHFGGFRDLMDSPLIIDMAIHSFDQARMISGCDPVSVYCHEFNPHGSWYAGAAAAVCIFEFTRGVLFTYRGSWAAEGFNTSWECQWRAHGARGALLWEGQGHPQAQVVAEGSGFRRKTADVAIPMPALTHVAHHGVLEEFVQCLRSGRSPQSECHDNIKSLAMCLAAVESARKGRKVAVRW